MIRSFADPETEKIWNGSDDIGGFKESSQQSPARSLW
jgi:hypothetical protein